MKKLRYEDGMDEIYAAFGKKSPDRRVLDIIFRRVESLPDEFMDFAVERLADEEKLPQNLGRFMRFELWPAFLDKNPQLRATREELAPCPRCWPSSPQRKRFWSPDGETHEIACDCCRDERAIRLLGQIPDGRLIAAGYLLAPPPLPNGAKMYRDKIARSLGGFKTRPRHAETLQAMEEAGW